MKVRCRTNLDIAKHVEKWPTSLEALPPIGGKIASGWKWSKHRAPLILKVVDITIYPKSQEDWEEDESEYYAEIELGVPNNMTISEFTDWYDKLQRHDVLMQINAMNFNKENNFNPEEWVPQGGGWGYKHKDTAAWMSKEEYDTCCKVL